MTDAAAVRRGLLIDLSSLQRLDIPEDDALARWVGETTAALLALPGAVQALLLDTSLPLPGSLHPAVLGSPLLRWNTATDIRRAAKAGPIAYLVPGSPGIEPGAALLPALVAERAVPLVMVLHGAADAAMRGTTALSRVGVDLHRHADLVLAVSRAAREFALHSLEVDPRRVVLLSGDTAEAIVDAVSRIDGDGVSPAVPRGSRLRIALVGALPPSDASSAAATARVAEALAARCHLDLVSDGQPDRAWLDRLGVGHLQADGPSRHGLATSYHAVVHAVGASAADLPALRSARRVPGVLWLHDLHLAEPHRAEAAALADPAASLAALLRRVYADRAPAPVLDTLDAGDVRAFDASAERRYGLLLTGEVVREARAVVVGSAAAARRLRLDQGPSAPCPRIAVIDPDDPDAAADQLLALVASLAAAAAPHGEAVA